MKYIKIEPGEISLIRKLLPLICLMIPWEFYFYSSTYSTGWGIKFSVLYANFDTQYGALFVDLMRQLSMLSYGGFLPSIRTVFWFTAAVMCITVAFYEVLRENIEIRVSVRTTGMILLACSTLTLISSVAVWNSSFKTIPVAPIFFAVYGYLLISSDREEYPEDVD